MSHITQALSGPNVQKLAPSSGSAKQTNKKSPLLGECLALGEEPAWLHAPPRH